MTVTFECWVVGDDDDDDDDDDDGDDDDNDDDNRASFDYAPLSPFLTKFYKLGGLENTVHCHACYLSWMSR